MGSSAAYQASRSRRLIFLLAAAPALAAAEALPTDPLERQCWLAHTAQRSAVDVREPVSVHFSNLKTGYRVRTPFWVEFGIRGMGVIPAGNKNDKAGHHHILVDTPLPRDHTAQIPFSATHKHFGKGQTGTELDLPPGKHTLRLLFADHEHRPYFVFSNEITVEVVGKRATDPAPKVAAGDADSCEAWYQDQRAVPRKSAEREVYVKNLRDDEAVSSPFTVSLGVLGAGFGVAPAGTSIKDTGHFRLTFNQKGGNVVRQNLADGRTEAIVDLPIGEYELQVSLHDGAGNQLLKGQPLKFSVNRHDRL